MERRNFLNKLAQIGTALAVAPAIAKAAVPDQIVNPVFENWTTEGFPDGWTLPDGKVHQGIRAPRFPKGIIMHCGGEIPHGWVPCDGRVLADGTKVPDLVDRRVSGNHTHQLMTDMTGDRCHSYIAQASAPIMPTPIMYVGE